MIYNLDLTGKRSSGWPSKIFKSSGSSALLKFSDFHGVPLTSFLTGI